jgi:hypothetical protein
VTLHEIVGAGVLAAFLGIALVVPIVISRWILRPVVTLAAEVKAPAQIAIVDILCLFLFVQGAMAFVRCNPNLFPAFFVRNMDIYCWFACGTSWWVGARTLSRAGIHDGKQRLLFLGVVLPTTLLSSLGIPSIVFITGMKIAQPHLFTFYTFAELAAVEVGLIALTCLNARLMRRITAPSPVAPPAEAV